MTVDVPANIRNTPCLKAEEILQLARIAVAQEELWGAPRDIEWAIDQVIFTYSLLAQRNWYGTEGKGFLNIATFDSAVTWWKVDMECIIIQF